MRLLKVLDLGLHRCEYLIELSTLKLHLKLLNLLEFASSDPASSKPLDSDHCPHNYGLDHRPLFLQTTHL